MNLEVRVKELVAGCLSLDVTDVKAESIFVDDLNADSLDTAEIIMDIEDEFDIRITTADAKTLNSVNAVTAYLNKMHPELATEVD